MHEDVYRCLAHACQRARGRGVDGTALRFVCASAVPSPHSHGPTRMMDRYSYTVYAHTLPCTPIVVRAYRRGGRAPRTRPACVRALVCVRWRARIRANACEHFPPPPSFAFIGSQAFYSASAFNANIGAWNTARVTMLVNVCAASGPARTAADCARSVADACAAVVRGGAADFHSRACARACSYAYKGVCGWIADGYTPVLECHRALSTSRLTDVQRTHA
jgi:hypothetical protein